MGMSLATCANSQPDAKGEHYERFWTTLILLLTLPAIAATELHIMHCDHLVTLRLVVCGILSSV